MAIIKDGRNGGTSQLGVDVNSVAFVGLYSPSTGTAISAANPLPVSNVPSGTQTVAGTVAATQSGAWAVTASGTVSNNQNGLSGFKSTQQAITVAASQLAATPLANRVSCVLAAPATNTATVWIGGSGVTTLTGFPLSPGQALSVDSNAAAALYAVATSGSQTLAILELAP